MEQESRCVIHYETDALEETLSSFSTVSWSKVQVIIENQIANEVFGKELDDARMFYHRTCYQRFCHQKKAEAAAAAES